MDSTERFTTRATDYVKFRPTYPHEVVETLRREFSVGPLVADVGSGTGISSALFLREGFEVFAVEPNVAMRAEAEKLLGGEARFHSVNGTSVETGLASRSVDLVIAAQSFHWFEPVATRNEFLRVLKPGGLMAILFNDRDAASPMGAAYETILKEFGNDYGAVKHRNVGAESHFAFLGEYREFKFLHAQALSFEGLLGRVSSSSYSPPPGDPKFPSMREKLRELFTLQEKAGVVELGYVTHLLVARPA
jgi:SAM-dependent methyltransferase